MYLSDMNTFIEPYEEGIFHHPELEERYPHLSRVWQRYYQNPNIHPEDSNAITHELIELREIFREKSELKHLARVTDRLIPFFSHAYKTGETIRCSSD